MSDLAVTEARAPSIGPAEVLVKILAAAINPSDIVSAEGRFPDAPLPRILGRDFAGRIVAGPAALIGTEVWGTGGDLGIARDGVHAEYVVLKRI
ncbi:MAG: alcohol dehydrogenase catalytic domain-containing protein [Bryobacteraceae bacterium]